MIHEPLFFPDRRPSRRKGFRLRPLALALACAVVFVGIGNLEAQPPLAPVGPEISLPSDAVLSAWYPDHADVVMAPDGSWTVIWLVQGEGQLEYQMARFSRAGERLGSDQIVASPDPQEGRFAKSADGDFVLGWIATDNDGDVRAQRFTSAGQAIGNELQVNSYTTGSQDGLALAVGSDDRLIVTWKDDRGAWGRLFDSLGAPLTGELPLQETAEDVGSRTAAAFDDDNGFSVVWGADRDLKGRFFDSVGVPLSGDLVVAEPPGNYRAIWPVLSAQDSGKFVVAWADDYPYGSDVRFRDFTLSDFPADPPSFQVGDGGATPGAGVKRVPYFFQRNPDLATFADEGFIVVWDQFVFGGGETVIEAAVVDASGNETGRFVINQTPSYERHARVAAHGSEAVIVWEKEFFEDASMVAQRFTRDFIFTDGFDSGNLTAWSRADGAEP